VLAVFITLWAIWINRFFSSVVRIQKERGQEVIQDGPYRFVRHPGYVGGILLALGNALVLGSLWALIPAGIMSLLLVIRTYLEDITLQRELPGYTDYTRKVKYRLLPWIW
jgi:protein-S-isoprenylcysteine O-methyltransferase Ste14